MAVTIEIEKKFKDFHLQVSFSSNAPTMGILGASGSGKSMTLRCIAGIETPDRGKIVLNGRTVYDSEKGINLRPQDRRIGYLFQNYALFPCMTVEENIGCGFRGQKKQKKEQVAAMVRRYRLEGLENRYPSQLSGGQQQRVALARMMMGEPEMILLDEPFSALDGHLKDILQKDMQEFLREYPGDMLLVTHSRDEVFKFCRELTLLKDGRALLFGDTRRLFQQPEFLEAARLTGCKNYSRIKRLDEFHIQALDWGLCLKTAVPVGEEITHVGVRGHWMKPVREKGENCLPVQVLECMETTFEYQYTIRNAGEQKAASLWWMRRKKGFEEDPGQEVPQWLYLPPEELMLLKE